MITNIEEINSIEDVIEYFENKGTPLTEDEKAMLYSDIFLKKNSDKGSTIKLKWRWKKYKRCWPSEN